jgi:hypothetical protein
MNSQISFKANRIMTLSGLVIVVIAVILFYYGGVLTPSPFKVRNFWSQRLLTP